MAIKYYCNIYETIGGDEHLGIILSTFELFMYKLFRLLYIIDIVKSTKYTFIWLIFWLIQRCVDAFDDFRDFM